MRSFPNLIMTSLACVHVFVGSTLHASATTQPVKNTPAWEMSYKNVALIGAAGIGLALTGAYALHKADALPTIQVSEQTQALGRMAAHGAKELCKFATFSVGTFYISNACHEFGHWILHPSPTARITLNPDANSAYATPVFASKWLKIDHWLPSQFSVAAYVNDPGARRRYAALPAHGNGYTDGFLTHPHVFQNMSFKNYARFQAITAAGPIAGFASTLGCFALYTALNGSASMPIMLSAYMLGGIELLNLNPLVITRPTADDQHNPGNYQHIKQLSDGAHMLIAHRVYTGQLTCDPTDKDKLCTCGPRFAVCTACKKGLPKQTTLYRVLQDERNLFGPHYKTNASLWVIESSLLTTAALSLIYLKMRQP